MSRSKNIPKSSPQYQQSFILRWLIYWKNSSKMLTVNQTLRASFQSFKITWSKWKSGSASPRLLKSKRLFKRSLTKKKSFWCPLQITKDKQAWASLYKNLLLNWEESRIGTELTLNWIKTFKDFSSRIPRLEQLARPKSKNSTRLSKSSTIHWANGVNHTPSWLTPSSKTTLPLTAPSPKLLRLTTAYKNK